MRTAPSIAFASGQPTRGAPAQQAQHSRREYWYDGTDRMKDYATFPAPTGATSRDDAEPEDASEAAPGDAPEAPTQVDGAVDAAPPA